MQDRQIIRRLWRLAERLAINAELIREATKPWQLNVAKRRSLRHLTELTHIKNRWSDTYKPSRRKGRPDIRRPGPYVPSFGWEYHVRRKRRENRLLESGVPYSLIKALYR